MRSSLPTAVVDELRPMPAHRVSRVVLLGGLRSRPVMEDDGVAGGLPVGKETDQQPIRRESRTLLWLIDQQSDESAAVINASI